MGDDGLINELDEEDSSTICMYIKSSQNILYTSCNFVFLLYLSKADIFLENSLILGPIPIEIQQPPWQSSVYASTPTIMAYDDTYFLEAVKVISKQSIKLLHFPQNERLLNKFVLLWRVFSLFVQTLL